jgi:hypothetical protein
MPKPKKVKEQEQPKLAIVTWLDAFDGPTGWVDPTEYRPYPVEPFTVGWVVDNFLDDHLTLVGTVLFDKNDQENPVYYSNPSHIPLGMIQSITYIDVPDPIRKSLLSYLNTRGINAG